MKKLLLILFIALITGRAAYSPGHNSVYLPVEGILKPFEALCEAVAIVESNNNPRAYNAPEQATGLYQVRPIRLRDYNQKTGHNLKMKDMYDPAKAKIVFLYYAKNIGWQNKEEIIRCWNGGANGMKYKQTKIYYNKVNAILIKKQENNR